MQAAIPNDPMEKTKKNRLARRQRCRSGGEKPEYFSYFPAAGAFLSPESDDALTLASA